MEIEQQEPQTEPTPKPIQRRKRGRQPMKQRLVRTEEGYEHQIDTPDGKTLGVNLSPESLKDMMVAMIAEMKKPDQATLDKAEADRIRFERQREDMIRVANMEIAATKANQAACSHRKENGRTLFHGQEHSDGMVHPICLRCQYLMPPYRLGADMATQFNIGQ